VINIVIFREGAHSIVKTQTNAHERLKIYITLIKHHFHTKQATFNTNLDRARVVPPVLAVAGAAALVALGQIAVGSVHRNIYKNHINGLAIKIIELICQIQ
jgi:hypothetical protein